MLRAIKLEMHESSVCRFFICLFIFSFGIARNRGFGTILGAGFLEYLQRILA